MSNNGGIQNKNELNARMLEAALELDRAKIMEDGRRLDEHDVWKICSKIVGDIRNNRDFSLRVNAQTYYRFKPYVNAGLPGLDVAKRACDAAYGTTDSDLRYAAEKVVADATGTAGVIHVYWECWIREQGQWTAAAWETLSMEQREAVRACIDALELKAAIKTFQAITHAKVNDNDIVGYAAEYIKTREAELGFQTALRTALRQGLAGVNRALQMQPPPQNIPYRSAVRSKG